MNDILARVEKALSIPRDYWDEARRDIKDNESLDGLLPASRALPDCPEADELTAEGAAAWRALLDIIHKKSTDSRTFKNALFLLMYFDNLFVYRELKALYPKASPEQRPWLDVAGRKIILRCLETPEDTQEALTREIVRNTWRGRLVTTGMMVDLAEKIYAQAHKAVHIRDMAISDGVTTLDLAEEAARRGVDIAITATDLRLYLLYAGNEDNAVVCYSNYEPCQYIIDGQTYGLRQPDVPAALEAVKMKLGAAVKSAASQKITLLAPQVDDTIESGKFAIDLKEEDAFSPTPDIAQADIIRIANLFVERTEEHRGYYYRHDILDAISNIGVAAKDGAYLYLDNFMQKVEHIGLWRKDAATRQWLRLPVGSDVAADLEGVHNIAIAEN